MADYKDMYYQLFNKLTDIIAELTEVQCQMEKMYVDTCSNDADDGIGE